MARHGKIRDKVLGEVSVNVANEDHERLHTLSATKSANSRKVGVMEFWLDAVKSQNAYTINYVGRENTLGRTLLVTPKSLRSSDEYDKVVEQQVKNENSSE